jgi:hypothetical protein
MYIELEVHMLGIAGKLVKNVVPLWRPNFLSKNNPLPMAIQIPVNKQFCFGSQRNFRG